MHSVLRVRRSQVGGGHECEGANGRKPAAARAVANGRRRAADMTGKEGDSPAAP